MSTMDARTLRRRFAKPRSIGRLALAALAAATLARPAAAAQQPAANDQAPAPGPPAPPDPTATSRREFPGGVVALTDITYSRINGFRPLKLDIYRSAAPSTTPKPLVVWLHGGGWYTGDQRGGGIQTPAYRNWPAVLASLAGRGYVVASITYRFTSEAKYPAQVQDAKEAVRWLKANAAAYGIDPNRVVAWGASAGGHIAALLGTTCNVAELERTPARAGAPSSCVQGVVDFYGPIDFKNEASQRLPGGVDHDDPNSSASIYLGCPIQSCPADRLRLSNPIAYVDRADPPFLIVHGTADLRVPPKQSQALYDALQKSGVRSELVMVPNVDHIFAGATDAQGKEILDKVFGFIDATTGVAPAG